MGLIAAGCGDDEEGGSSDAPATEESSDQGSSDGGSSEGSATDRVNAAVENCKAKAQELGGTAGAALDAGCTTFGTTVTQALAQGGEQVEGAIAASAQQCTAAVQQLPAGEARDALTELCDAIASVDEG